ncbi:SWIM zinc finger family protein [Maribellus sediminis]
MRNCYCKRFSLYRYRCLHANAEKCCRL